MCAYCGADKERSRQEHKKQRGSFIVNFVASAVGLLAGGIAWGESGILIGIVVTIFVSSIVQRAIAAIGSKRTS